MSRLQQVRLSLLCILFSACGGVKSPPLTGPVSDLQGAWISNNMQEHIGSPCPWIIEFFDDQSVETNHLSDDRSRVCVAARVPYVLDDSLEVSVLHIGGQLSQCLYKRDGDRLKLTCEDHGTPAGDEAKWIEFEPLEARTVTSLEDLTGTWLVGAFMGTPLVLTIDGTGRMVSVVDDEEGTARAEAYAATLEILDKQRLTLRGGSHRENCLYRATHHRITLRCQPEQDGWPATIFDPDGEPETMVFFRQK